MILASWRVGFNVNAWYYIEFVLGAPRGQATARRTPATHCKKKKKNRFRLKSNIKTSADNQIKLTFRLSIIYMFAWQPGTQILILPVHCYAWTKKFFTNFCYLPLPPPPPPPPQGAFWGLVFGELVGLTRMVLEFIYSGPGCGAEDTRPNMIKNFHYLHFACFLYGATLLAVVVLSLMTDPIAPGKVSVCSASNCSESTLEVIQQLYTQWHALAIFPLDTLWWWSCLQHGQTTLIMITWIHVIIVNRRMRSIPLYEGVDLEVRYPFHSYYF